ncbi:M24 family metallopeptidase [Tepidanaerobacter syntrophicus]|uniref:Xaa-Pro aminopeptidase n=1 Tax=Tepidanaerobacter syntrophicus TaxID=224999 RepID=A0A0U9HKJ6_9FIRM|nr:Xaa-Pro peptidase family protein [Tepidanaerobacter syntrophicus]GAQ24835.1 Xaa-Pro aminopeptidase [Tepidanaerobacter syntrophicus]GLI18897.1 aminopeptidase [Tepidanaerobacter syntrophicus]
MKERLEKLFDLMKKENIDGIFLAKDANVRYVSGFTGSESYALVSKDARALITDSRYTEQAEQECEGFDVIKWKAPHPTLPEAACGVCEKYGIKKLGFEKDVLTVDFYDKLKENLKGIELIGTVGLVEKIRQVKDENEISYMREASRITDEAFNEVLNYIKPGVTEKDVKRELIYLVQKKGADDVGFSFIVASGENGSKPHAIPSDKPIEAGDFVTMDIGSLYNGYRSDMTRTVAVKMADERQRYIYNVVKRSQEEGVKAVRAGVECRLIDKAARDVIISEGVEGMFEYGIGHGVGLEIHEAPAMSPNSTHILEAGNVITVEPGIYIPGWGGVRIEDMVAVTKDGCEILTRSPKELIIV